MADAPRGLGGGPDSHDWHLRVSEAGGFVNDTDEPKDPTLACLYWQHRWAATAVALTDALVLLDRPQQRSTSLSPHDFRLLDQWGRQLQEVFGETPYLVGSVARASRDPRDVDVRMLLPEGAGWIAATRLRLLHTNLSVTMWGRHVTGLPIDFQFQPADEYHGYDDDRRHALGISTRVAISEATEQSDAAVCTCEAVPWAPCPEHSDEIPPHSDDNGAAE